MALQLVILDDGTLPGIADAIRAKTGGTELLLPSHMAAAIDGIKNLRVETGTITPAEDITSLELPCAANPKMVIVCLTDAALETVVQDDMVAAMRAHVVGATYAIGSDSNTLNATLAITQYHNSGGKRGTVTSSCAIDPVKIAASSTYQWRAGLAYAWTAYYWEDD